MAGFVRTGNAHERPTKNRRFESPQARPGQARYPHCAFSAPVIPMRRTERKAFSLIELLVAIALIAVLAALIVPSAFRSRRQAAAVQCLSNLRSLAAGCAGYAVDDPLEHLLPVHPTAHGNTRRDDGFYDYGGADGAANAFDGELAAQGPRAADTRPLNAHLGLSGPGSDAFEVYRCPRDTRLDAPMTYPSWPVWDASLHQHSAFSVVGTSYWGNAVRSEERVPPSKDAAGEPRKRYHSFGPFLRPASRVPAPGSTVLLMEMPALFNFVLFSSEGGFPRFGSLGIPGWHDAGPRFNFAFCDGHAEAFLLPAQWISEGAGDEKHRLRENGVRLDCYPDPPVPDAPFGPER